MKNVLVILALLLIHSKELTCYDTVPVTIKVLTDEGVVEAGGFVKALRSDGTLVEKRINGGVSPEFTWNFTLPEGTYTFQFELGSTYETRAELSDVAIGPSSEAIYTFRPVWNYPGYKNWSYRERRVRLGSTLLSFVYAKEAPRAKRMPIDLPHGRVSWHGVTLSAENAGCDIRLKVCRFQDRVKADCGAKQWSGDHAELREGSMSLFRSGILIGRATFARGGLKCIAAD